MQITILTLTFVLPGRREPLSMDGAPALALGRMPVRTQDAERLT
ncbi:hypothetical protein FIU83_10315 [Halomonas sp. THAF5a]|nr:hypothetical protein [Halomonas sp. THAF5a]QFU02034.1 hypothetical protein FIU83_10315 [Halomonas sp. THAF5a]